MKNQKIIPLLFFFSFSVFVSQAQQAGEKIKRDKLTKNVDSILQSQVNSNRIPGAVIEIKKGNQVLCKKAFGYAQRNDYENKPLADPVKMTTDDLFDLASLTKVVGTTTSIMLLVDRGLIKVDDPVGKYIPAFNVGDKKQITIRNLLTHTAGLLTWYPLFYRASNKQEAYKLIGELPLAFPVGEVRKYSDLGFILLGEIIEKVSGMPLDQFDQKNIFIPLGMHHTTYNPLTKNQFTKFAATSHGNPFETRMVHDTSLGYVFKEIDPNQWNGWRHYTLRGEVNDGNAWYALHGVGGHAGLFSTVDDLQKLVDMLMHDGKVGFKQFISKKTIKLFLTKDDFKNGLGWMMDTDDSFIKNGPVGTFGHLGFTGTSIAVVPSLDISVILLINRQNMGLLNAGYYYNPNPIRREIFDAVLHYCK
ncbi:MAG TPA: serine hydrolase [Hanamia sp.]|nr:serine hydrolase [Hanamia sp.]